MQTFQNIDAANLKDRLENNEHEPFMLVDVRNPIECVRGVIPGARIIPLETLSQHAAELAHAPSVVLYCQGGMRSAAACQQLVAAGITQVVNLDGGIMGWVAEGNEMVGLNDNQALHTPLEPSRTMAFKINMTDEQWKA